LDLLLVVDNSISMGDKQDVLAKTIPDLVQRLTDPLLGIVDLHVGAITSSLGGHGAASCNRNEGEDDRGHLVATRPRAPSLALPSGFGSGQRPSPTDALVANVQAMVSAGGENGCGLEATLEAMYRFVVDPKPSASITLTACGASTCATPTGTDVELL